MSNGEQGSNEEQFIPEKVVEGLWGRLAGGTSGQLSGLSREFAERWGERLNSGEINQLQEEIFAAARQEAKRLMSFLEAKDESWLDTEPEQGSWSFGEVRQRCAGLRFLMYAGRHLQEMKVGKMKQEEGISMEEVDRNEYAVESLLGTFHEATKFANWAAYDAEAVKTGSLGFEGWKGRVIDGLKDLGEYLGENGGVEELAEQSTEAVKGAAGRELGNVVDALQQKFRELPVSWEVDYKALGEKWVIGKGADLYTALRNLVGNAVEEQLKSGGSGDVEVRVDLVDNGKGFEVVCVNQGQFPQEWLDDKGSVVVTGKTTKEGGSGVGLKIITDYIKSVGGSFRVNNLPDGRVETRLRGQLTGGLD